MSPSQFLNLIVKNLLWLVIIPIILAGSIFYFTRNEKKLYSSETVVYTGIASGYNLNGNSKVDYFAASNAFDNFLTIINSRDTKEEVAVNLLASHLVLAKHDPTVMGLQAFEDLNKLVSPEFREKFVKPTLGETVESITAYLHSSDTNEVYKLIYSNNPFYSLNALANLKPIRISSSDLLKISYETYDAAICKNTLEIVLNVFGRKQKLLKGDQTESVIAFFEREVKRASDQLDSTEQIFLKFHENNDIINYYEQSKAIIGEKVDLNMLDNSLEMDKIAQNKGLDKINNNIKGREYQMLYGSEVLSERSRLSDIYNKIAFNEINNGNNPAAQPELDSLKKLSVAIENNMKTALTRLYTHTNTPNGIPTKDMMEQWVKSTVAVEQSKARLAVMNNRKRQFNAEFRRLAPLGAMLKKVERDIDVSERQYLELLSSLNTARLAQQNNEISSRIKVLDPPYYPLKPVASKRMVMIIAGAFAGFILVLATVIAKFLMNRNLQQPSRAGKEIGLDLLGVYPLLQSGEEFVSKANLRLIQQLFGKVDFNKKPLVIGVCSIQQHEGKSTLIGIWKQELQKLNFVVDHVEWTRSALTRECSTADVVIIEFPSLETSLLTAGTIPPLDQSIMICRANRKWTLVDRELLDLFIKTTDTDPLLVLNGVDKEFAKEFVGKMPGRKGFGTTYGRRQLEFNFSKPGRKYA